MARLRYNGLKASLGGALTNSGTTISFAATLKHSGGTNVPTISGGNIIPLAILDANGNLAEIVYMTAYTAGATTGTITRGREGTTGVAHSAGRTVVQAPTVSDFAVIFRGRIAPNTAVTGAANIPWTEDTDTHAAHSGGTFTVPIGMGGLYLISLAWKPNAAVTVRMDVRKNGVTVAAAPANGAAAFTGMSASLILDLNDGDALTIQPSAGFTTTNDTAYNTWCHVMRVG